MIPLVKQAILELGCLTDTLPVDSAYSGGTILELYTLEIRLP